MALKQQIDADIKAAMLAKDSAKLLALRAVKSLILLEETKGGAGEMTADEEMKILTKAVKQRKDSAEIFKTQGREDLLEKELAEIAFIEVYLPKQMSEEETEAAVIEIIGRVGASSPADMGKVMGVATKELAGKADGKIISMLVKKILSQ